MGWGANQHGQITLGAKYNMSISNPVNIYITIK
jgi:hypothetical protein